MGASVPDLYRIRDWDRHFENNRTRELKRLPWVPIPTDLSNDAYIELVEHRFGPAHFGVWIACVEIAVIIPTGESLMQKNATFF